MSLPELVLVPGRITSLALVRSEDGAEPTLATRVELVDLGERLEVRFDCDDPEPFATKTGRDDSLWEEDVVEVFLAPGAESPRSYAELEVNPLGTLFDARVDSPHGDRREMRVDRAWDCPGLEWSASMRANGWNARLAIPWRALAPDRNAASIWRANFFRIDRPAAGTNARSEFSAWSPSFVSPADFHRPARFGILRRLG